jgi:hypothetical protein
LEQEVMTGRDRFICEREREIGALLGVCGGLA